MVFTDVLPKFPPDTVKMKKPICLQPWDSSPEIVEKLFKVHINHQLLFVRSVLFNIIRCVLLICECPIFMCFCSLSHFYFKSILSYSYMLLGTLTIAWLFNLL